MLLSVANNTMKHLRLFKPKSSIIGRPESYICDSSVYFLLLLFQMWGLIGYLMVAQEQTLYDQYWEISKRLRALRLWERRLQQAALVCEMPRTNGSAIPCAFHLMVRLWSPAGIVQQTMS